MSLHKATATIAFWTAALGPQTSNTTLEIYSVTVNALITCPAGYINNCVHVYIKAGKVPNAANWYPTSLPDFGINNPSSAYTRAATIRITYTFLLFQHLYLVNIYSTDKGSIIMILNVVVCMLRIIKYKQFNIIIDLLRNITRNPLFGSLLDSSTLLSTKSQSKLFDRYFNLWSSATLYLIFCLFTYLCF